MRTAPAGTVAPASMNALSQVAGVAATLLLGYLALSQHPPAVSASPVASSLSAPPELGTCLMDRAGFLSGSLFGAISLALDWSGSMLACEGNARPRDGGVRLFFAGRPDHSSDRLVMVLGIPSPLETLAGREHETNLTIIDENTGRFFNSGKGRCWTHVHEVAPLGEAAAREIYRVEGEFYCAGTIPSLTDAASVTPGHFRFSGRLTLGGP